MSLFYSPKGALTHHRTILVRWWYFLRKTCALRGSAASSEAVFFLCKKKQKRKDVTAMAIYHLEAKVVSRGTGRSAVAASAYLSCSKILNDYDGIQHDFTRKQGLVWEQIFLPDNAPTEWADRAVLWNAVEEVEKSKDSRLARELVVALPVELDKNQWVMLLTDFIRDNFVADGMCADVAIHDTDGHNPHAHILLTVRPLDKQGKWQHKTEKEYLCIRNGEEKGFTATEFKTAQADGWEKQYQYKVGRKKMYMPSSVAESRGYERVSKYPKSTKYGRQNPISERWNSDEQLILWRKAWEDISNRYLELSGKDERIDCRSNAERGITEQPTVHEGVTARILEKKGIISERCELNRQIKADNALLRKLKSTVKKLTNAVRKTVPYMAEAMEKVRQNVTIFCYQLGHIRNGRANLNDYLSVTKSEAAKYDALSVKISENEEELKNAIIERDSLPFWNLPKKKKLTARITELTELLEELRSERTAVLKKLQYESNISISDVRNDIDKAEKNLVELEKHDEKFTAELNSALKKYAQLREEAAELDQTELYEARQGLRSEYNNNAALRLQKLYSKNYSSQLMSESRTKAAKLLNEEEEARSIREKIRQLEVQKEKTPILPKRKSRGAR